MENKNIYIDYKNCANQGILAQAIKILATNNKDITFNLITDKKTVNTFSYDNIKLVEDDTSFKFKIAFNDIENEDKYLLIDTLLKDSERVHLIGRNNDNFNEEEILNLYKKHINKNFQFAILAFNLKENSLADFDLKMKDDENYLGKINPVDIFNKKPNLLITDLNTASIFIDTLKYVVSINKEMTQKSKKEGGLASFFSFKPSEVSSSFTLNENTLFDNRILYINENEVIYKLHPNADYNYYFYSIDKIINTIKSN